MSNLKGRKRTSFSINAILGAVWAAILIACSFAAHADDKKFPPHGKTNINLAVVSNFKVFPHQIAR